MLDISAEGKQAAAKYSWRKTSAGSLGVTALKTLLLVKAAVEGLAGLLLLLFPSQAVSLLVGMPLESPGGYVLGRIAAAALLALGIACWAARDESKSRAAVGLILALVLYDATVVVLLLYVRLVAGNSGLILWPAVALHWGLGAWSILCLGRGLPRPVV